MKNLLFICAWMMLISSCRSTELIGSWAREDTEPKKFKEIGVVVLTPNMSGRSIVEVDIATVLHQKGIKGTPTFDIFPFAAKRELFSDVEAEEMRQKIKERVEKFGFDGLLIVAILNQETETRYNQGSSFSFAYPAYQYNYYGYYQYAYATIHTPGYYSTTTTYFLESNLYDVASEGLIWTAQTKTKKKASSIHKESEVFANIIAQELLKDKALQP
ncbi:MAG: hypothetical protein DHS20C17_12950 [Cyclobacteriaceae bacterium]|nr:MAG: hypothetical protein DHS20C17_12950 [Cyclobacteriaceae bacterium]